MSQTAASGEMEFGTPNAGLASRKLMRDSTTNIVAEIARRAPSFVREWSGLREMDAGGVLVHLIAEELSPVTRRINRLPEKATIDWLNLLGVRPIPARPSEAIVQFNVAKTARRSTLIPRGFQIGSQPADDSSGLVVFETMNDFFATPATLTRVVYSRRGLHRDIALESGTPFFAFGSDPKPGDALHFGLSSSFAPTDGLTIGFRLQTYTAAAGYVSSTFDSASAPLLEWQLTKSGSPLEVVVDETLSLTRSGITILRLPVTWEPSVEFAQAGEAKNPELFWFSVRLVQGAFVKPPRVASIDLNLARVQAVRTVYDEVLVSEGSFPIRELKLSMSPVLSGSVQLVVDSASLDDEIGSQAWTEVDDLLAYGPNDYVFSLDANEGVLNFGDGLYGAALPYGFRSVVAKRYQVCSGKAGAVGVDSIKTLINSAPLLLSATNPNAASGGLDRESDEDTRFHGPAMLRSGGRSVTEIDYAVLARQTPGADVRKAMSVSGYHPDFPGRALAGVVGVVVVSRVEVGPPVADEATLRAVAKYLSTQVAPAGAEIVACPAIFRNIRVEAEVKFLRDANVGESIVRLSQSISSYLDPLHGGDDEHGWPFGGTLQIAKLTHLLLSDPSIRRVEKLRVVLDGTRMPLCGDVELGPMELFWSDSHAIVPASEEADL